MCGRFTLLATPILLREQFHPEDSLPQLPRFNVAPTQEVAAIRLDTPTERREMVRLRWGLIPSWAKDSKIGNSLINARGETVAEKPSFRFALKSRRCLILADGFFEWRNQDGKKQPFYFRLADHSTFAFAGLWERWSKGENGVVESCTIITTEANDLVRPVHERTPVILLSRDYDTWLHHRVLGPDALQSLFRPYPADQMTATAVSMRVNSPRHDDAGCIEAVALIPRLQLYVII
jgi:putative SOS response-associated peptidase YedK